MSLISLRMTSHRVFGQAQGERLFFGIFLTKVNLKRDRGYASELHIQIMDEQAICTTLRRTRDLMGPAF